MGQIAYELTAEYEGEVEVFDTVEAEEAGEGRIVPKFGGGTVALADGGTFDIAQALQEGDGTIVIDDSEQFLATVLDEYPALKRVVVPEGATVIAGYSRQTVPVLRRELNRRRLPTSGNKEALVARLEESDRVAAGDEPTTTPEG